MSVDQVYLEEEDSVDLYPVAELSVYLFARAKVSTSFSAIPRKELYRKALTGGNECPIPWLQL